MSHRQERHWTMSTHIPSNYYASTNGGRVQQAGAATSIFKKRFDRIDWKKLGKRIDRRLSCKCNAGNAACMLR
jgi:hypothetical protein